MKCSNPKCNAEMYPSDLFCGQCGLPLSIAVQSHAFENKMPGGVNGGSGIVNEGFKALD